MTGRHRPSQPMHADDPVAPGIKRSRSAFLVAAGLLVIVGAIAGSIVTLSAGVQDASDKASLSSEETQQLREFLADRGKQRDLERADVQHQLDDQRAVLCAAIKTLSASARPEARVVLGKAAADLKCGALPAAARSSSTADRSVPRPSSTAAATERPAAVQATPGQPSASSTRATTPRPRTTTARPPTSQPATPRPAPSPTSTPQPLAPVLAPVCDLLGICL